MTLAFNDIRFAVRGLIRSPLFAIVAILSLALGIGANTAIFTLIDQILLRKLPVKAPDELVMLYQTGAHNGSNMGQRMHSYPMYQEFQKRAEPLAEVLCRRLARGVGQHRQPDRAAGYRDGLGQLLLDARRACRRSAACSAREEDDQVYQGHPVVVLSYDYWSRRFSRDPGVRRQEDPRQQLSDDDRRRVGGRVLGARSGAVAADSRADPDEAGGRARMVLGATWTIRGRAGSRCSRA